jgi:acetyl esterase
MDSIREYEVESRDVEYLRHGERALQLRLYRPRGSGPFPAIVEIHGGAWCLGDRTRDEVINEPLARSGVVVAALDFRMPPEASYPASMADINYGIRWLRAHAREFVVVPEQIGVMGSSSGGHQAMLTAMRPADGRYGALTSDAVKGVSAEVNCVIMLWPVIDPLARYRYAKKLKAGGKYPQFVDLVLPLHDQYWRDEEEMAEGNPALALERHEDVSLPPALYIQGTDDIVHPRIDLDRFVVNYRKAGGELELELYEGAAEGFITRNPTSPAARRAIERIVEFVHKHRASN